MSRYKVNFEDASGAVWVDAESPDEAQSVAADILMGFVGDEGEPGHGQVDVSSMSRAEVA